MASKTPPEPIRPKISNTHPHFDLYERVKDAITVLPSRFKSETYLAGIMAPDLYTLNSVLGASIEEEMTRTLNAMRTVWDPDDKYALYRFIRQPQTFPDVLLRKSVDGEILMGIELKGWFLLAKEGEPSYRYVVTEAACATLDLLVVVPWTLSSVLSGNPVVYDPYIDIASFACQARNHYWQYTRDTKDNRDIEIPKGIENYPSKADKISDRPAKDGGGNFGRLARSGIRDFNAYVSQMAEMLVAGVKVRHWQSFLKAIGGTKGPEQIEKRLLALQKQLQSLPADAKEEAILGVIEHLSKIADLPLVDSPEN